MSENDWKGDVEGSKRVTDLVMNRLIIRLFTLRYHSVGNEINIVSWLQLMRLLTFHTN